MKPVFDDGSISLYLGDAFVVLPELDLADVAAVVTDPPYGDTSLAWDRWPSGWPALIPSHVRHLWSFGSMRTLLAHFDEFSGAGWSYSQEVIWEKHNGSGFAADRFKRVHEFAMHFYRGRWSSLPVYPVMVEGASKRTVRRKATPPHHLGARGPSSYTSIDGGPKMMRSVIPVRSCHGHVIHPTEKPVGILDPLLRYCTARGETVLDLFAGSGATLDAARLTGRRAIGIEAREDYAEAACRRLSQGVLSL